jgi:hypothetical protein
MIYYVFGKEIFINEMKNPEGHHGSNFEINGDESLNKLGLNSKFYFRAPFYFSNEAPIDIQLNELRAKNLEQYIFADFLVNNIKHGELTSQFDMF